MRHLSLFLLLTLTPFAGCMGGSDVSSAPSEPPTDCATETGCEAPTTGTVTGIVTDADHLPIPGTLISATLLAELPPPDVTVTSDAGGEWHLELPTGEYTVAFLHPDYESHARPLSIAEGYNGYLDVHLELQFSKRPRVYAPEAWLGHFDCGLEFAILAGDCLILYENVTGQESPVFSEENAVAFQVEPNWSQIVVELTWVEGGQNQLDGLHLYLAPSNGSDDPDAHHSKYAVAEGNVQPLRIDLLPGTPHATGETDPATSQTYVFGPEGGYLLALVYPRGQFADEIGSHCDPLNPSRCFLGVGAALDLEFTLYLSVFYNQLAPEGYTRLPPA